MRKDILSGVQLVISIILILAVLMQQRGSGVGSLFGGPSSIGGGEFFRARRGFERFLFYLTIIMSIFLVITSFLFIVL